jgi:hypothetical protein
MTTWDTFTASASGLCLGSLYAYVLWRLYGRP